ncbi:MAG TPA: PEGA domain-containing protein [Thermoanaerobaculia bacterium]|nr:PEGA domain-containing protein [Thermoanaerobaculia bacterium]
MKKLLSLLLLFALACTSTSTTTAPATRPVADMRVNVAIESRPDWGEAYVNGKFIGTTPLVARLTPGEHTIEVRHPDRSMWKRELTVLANSPTRVMALLPK